MSSEVKYSIVNKINALWQKSFEPEGRCRQLETPVCFYEFEVSKQIAWYFDRYKQNFGNWVMRRGKLGTFFNFSRVSGGIMHRQALQFFVTDLGGQRYNIWILPYRVLFPNVFDKFSELHIGGWFRIASCCQIFSYFNLWWQVAL